MVSDASPRPTNPNIKNKYSFLSTYYCNSETSSNHEYAQDGYLKRPHPTIIGGDIRSDSGWFLGGLGVVRPLARDYLVSYPFFSVQRSLYPYNNFGKKQPTNSYIALGT